MFSKNPPNALKYPPQTESASQFDPRIATETLCRSSLCVAEIKCSLSSKIERGFHAVCADLAPTRESVVYPGRERYALAADIEAVSLGQLAVFLSGAIVMTEIALRAHAEVSF